MANAVNLPGERLAGLWADLAHKVQKGVISLDELALFTQRQNPFGDSVIAVDYNLSLAEMIAIGQYDWTNDDITANHFPIVGAGVVRYETKPFHFDCFISSEDAVKAIEADGWEAAKIEHLLAYGAKYPEEQRKYPIIALSSSRTVGGRRDVPYLDRGDGRRSLDLYRWGGGWDGHCRFLAVRKAL